MKKIIYIDGSVNVAAEHCKNIVNHTLLHSGGARRSLNTWLF